VRAEELTKKSFGEGTPKELRRKFSGLIIILFAARGFAFIPPSFRIAG
jgi:hypothetical protein